MKTTVLPGHPYHAKTDAELRYIVRDAGEAANAMRGHDYKAECKYLDQVNDACTILNARDASLKRQSRARNGKAR